MLYALKFEKTFDQKCDTTVVEECKLPALVRLTNLSTRLRKQVAQSGSKKTFLHRWKKAFVRLSSSFRRVKLGTNFTIPSNSVDEYVCDLSVRF